MSIDGEPVTLSPHESTGIFPRMRRATIVPGTIDSVSRLQSVCRLYSVRGLVFPVPTLVVANLKKRFETRPRVRNAGEYEGREKRSTRLRRTDCSAEPNRNMCEVRNAQTRNRPQTRTQPLPTVRGIGRLVLASLPVLPIVRMCFHAPAPSESEQQRVAVASPKRQKNYM